MGFVFPPPRYPCSKYDIRGCHITKRCKASDCDDSRRIYFDVSRSNVFTIYQSL
ncbi:hypothetical protein DICPUDRAFT_71601, partial [Dictyostelium purpureum]